MKNTLFILGLFFSLACYSKEKSVHIVDELMKEIPYVNVVFDKAQGIGFMTNSKGIVNIDIEKVEKYSEMNIEISCIGYESLKISFNEFISKDSIVLKQALVQIPEICVVSKRQKTRYIGNHKLKGYPGYYCCQPGDEIATYIESNNINKTHIFKNIQVYIAKRGIPDSEFRIIIYSSTNNSYTKPDTVIFNKSLIAKAMKGNEWVFFDILKYNIKVPTKGFFVSVLWLNNSVGYKISLDKKHNKNSDYTLYGQVLKAKCPEDSTYINYVWSRNILYKDEWNNEKNLMIPLVRCGIIEDNF